MEMQTAANIETVKKGVPNTSSATPAPETATKLRVTKSIEFKTQNNITALPGNANEVCSLCRTWEFVCKCNREGKLRLHFPVAPQQTVVTTLAPPGFEPRMMVLVNTYVCAVIKEYHTRGPMRGLMVMFGYSNFQTGPEYRDIESDYKMMEELFSEFKFSVETHRNLGKEETLKAMKSLSPAGYECVFIVVSSHGYERKGKWDTEFCCSDGSLIHVYDVVNIFNNVNYPELEGVPKVFIFQMCRGTKSLSGHNNATDCLAKPVVKGGDQCASAARVEGVRDSLVAFATLPGFEHVRNNRGAAGSLYMQALCEVFAAHAHECHVSELFQGVDTALQSRCPTAVTDVQNWGGFGNLYLHPGLVEDADGNPTEVQ